MHASPLPFQRTPRGPPHRAFTIIELLTVIGIIVLLLAVAIPSFSSLLASSNRAMAENKLRSAIASAAATARRSPKGSDTVAAFLFDPKTNRTRVQVYVYTADYAEQVPGTPLPPPIQRGVYVPDLLSEPIELPPGWNVRGLVPAGWMGQLWYAGVGENYENLATTHQWVFPENAFFDPKTDDPEVGARRQTFIIRFEGSTGRVATGNLDEILLLDPGLDRAARSDSVFTKASGAYNILESADLTRFVARVLQAPITDLDDVQRRHLLGDISVDTILARPVAQIVLYKEQDLSAAVGQRLDRASNSFYSDTKSLGMQRWKFLPTNPAVIFTRTNNWIATGFAESTPSNTAIIPESPPSKVYALDLYSGRLREVLR